jgi:archaellum component FlaC
MSGLDTSLIANEKLRHDAARAAGLADDVGELKIEITALKEEKTALKTKVSKLEGRLKKLEEAFSSASAT